MTATAPSASAFSTSLPRRTPPSTSTGTAPPTASTTSGSTSSVADDPSSCRPPWFDTTTPSTPCDTATSASSAVITPFASTGNPPPASRIHARSSQVNDGSITRSPRTPTGNWNPLRVSRCRTPSTGVSTVHITAE